MSTNSALLNYNDVEEALQETLIEHNPAQAHGIICGLICATSGKADHRWQQLLLSNTSDSIPSLLTELYESSYHQISEFSFEFTLLLPDDQVDIHQRAEALGLWCQGFITGLDAGHIQTVDRPESEVTEAINDIIKISDVSFDETDNNDEDETAYYELVEYVRLAILMIFHELKAEINEQSDMDKDKLN